ncbi:pyridoxamine 5'-phosphate oxidase family protein [Haloferax mediterranei ATCC 33500]|uniref:Flavin-nucleotide-binding protein n=1 Tax=Haloferax mediterranei (strain ATCC 33500 / DSM 1411 / JCM 8866 / NBRC 14739 / NCIMB 2177 / R-4) TaxID=523841 RepID=I3R7K7_HALMT|nr:pyridoxamine 5'-phosphate oxidase family protein [Haloferax mediterranei]AFK20217.1 hypothetical protein HFX_2536 [Haloferax mediterranei ATCC 33500]AHZ23591.1 flavin-nucleotide-binding protein [Haloferax mediterranei ATCC 33500]ELZ99075.1 hypothetical protein C439_14489 [Haloferax mediterranei ATCC 33500]MDX5987028.1 pyridoxamine 5'-phosphate oxidase family protein [Haloferax mediterranei ATCC 33500]QCQ76345.1 pyridoxamine 5'-phosphate oxidase family protein [Haloferax mediterranei ATCC 33
MTDTSPIEMDEDERDEFLGNGGTGVISFSTPDDDAPHSVPVSYGYDATESTFYFRLALGGNKSDVIDRAVTFVTYSHEDDEWRSVVASGRLEEVSEESIATESLQGLERVHIPLVDIFGVPSRDVPFGFYRLTTEKLTSRKESKTMT